ncbi:MAG: helix-turn-helix transcriptional regulator [Acidobacteria bacterium]|nr:helix-turn-helix transcriptional regulator [Acidobacteriota bacterium]
MTGGQLRAAREQKGWNQEQARLKLGVSQAYLSLLERGERRIPEKLALKAVRVYGLSEAFLPLKSEWDEAPPPDNNSLASDLAALGYPGLSHLKSNGQKKNPAEFLLAALGKDNLDSRLVDALPWVVWRFHDLNWQWLINSAKVKDLQNRLGFVTSVARRLAEMRGEREKAASLAEQESVLERSRLLREDTLCHESLTEAEKQWLRKNRPAEAKHWRLLTDLTPEQLNHVI